MTSGKARWAPTVAVAIAVSLTIAATVLGACGLASRRAAEGAGGTLTVACQPPANLDPHFAALASEEMINHQIYDWLVTLDGQNQPTPSLATEWEMSADGKTWEFTIREGVKFSDGTPLTVDDVVYSFNRLRDPKVGAPTSSLFTGVGEVASDKSSRPIFSLFSGIIDIASSDSSHVVFAFNAAKPEFVKDLADYHAAVISKSVKDPAREWVGTGPFMVGEYVPGHRMTLVRNPNYWRTASGGARLPYLDGLTFLFSSDEASQAQALQRGDIDFMAGLSAELAQRMRRDPEVTLLTTKSNFHFLVHMRSDEGHPGADSRLRLALRSGTDYQGLVEAVRPGLSTVGNGTIVGPTYGEYYWEQAPRYDPDGARKLLAEAGYANGFALELYAPQHGDAKAFATAWKKQMARIGVTVTIKAVPGDVYYGENGEASWTQCDFGVTDWADRATPVAYFNLAYVTGGVYNESHWSDTEFDALTTEINSELDAARRAELYKHAQQILWERGPVVVFGHEDSVAGVSGKVRGITLPSDWARVRFAEARFVE